jgi:class 3 adenylate cyclase
MDPNASHVQLEWSQPFLSRMLGELARHNTLVRFDPRGSGLSDRVFANNLDEYVLDLEAVVTRLQLREFDLSSIQSGSLTSMAFAARHLQQVHRLVFLNGYARNADLLDTAQAQALWAAAANDWEMATEAMGALVFGPGREESRAHGAFIRACIGPEYFAHAAVMRTMDASSFLDSLTMPALVLHHTGVKYVTEEMTRELASRIPDARLTTIEGAWGDDPEGLSKRVVNFINADRPRTVSTVRSASGVRTILFTDLVGHTEMMRRLGDALGRELLREHEQTVRDSIERHGGIEIKSDGDSFMVSFGSVAAAAECAVEVQRAFANRNESNAEPLHVRMGLNSGEPIEDNGDLFGESVILASRIADQAIQGEILVAEAVRHLLAGKGFVFIDRGEFVPKGFDDAVHLFEVDWRA